MPYCSRSSGVKSRLTRAEVGDRVVDVDVLMATNNPALETFSSAMLLVLPLIAVTLI